jgi:Tfp pilus assembly protein PilF
LKTINAPFNGFTEKEHLGLQKARSLAENVIKIEPSWSAGHCLLAGIMQEIGEERATVEAFEQAITLCGYNANLLCDYVSYLRKTQKNTVEKEEALLKMAMEQEPTHGHALCRYARFLLEKGELDEAEKYFKEAIVAGMKSGPYHSTKRPK